MPYVAEKELVNVEGGLNFPLDTGEYQSRITFQAIKVEPPKLAVRFNTSETVDELDARVDEINRELNKKEFGDDWDDDWDGEKSGFGESNISDIKGTPSGIKVYSLPGEMCSLHLPLSYQVNDVQDYSTASLGLAGMGLLAGANKGEALAEAGFESVKSAFSSIGDLFKTGQASRVAIARGADFMPIPEGAKSALKIAGRVAMNPNLRAQYNGPNIREFNFTFKLLPKSADESAAAQNIIKFFRFHSYADQIKDNIAFDYPNLFKIKLESRVSGRYSNIGTPIKLCYLKVVSINYNPTSTVLHTDGSPTEMDINLTFTEYKPLDRDDVRHEDDQFYAYEGFKA